MDQVTESRDRQLSGLFLWESGLHSAHSKVCTPLNLPNNWSQEHSALKVYYSVVQPNIEYYIIGPSFFFFFFLVYLQNSTARVYQVSNIPKSLKHRFVLFSLMQQVPTTHCCLYSNNLHSILYVVKFSLRRRLISAFWNESPVSTHCNDQR